MRRKRSCNSRNSRKTRKPQEVDFDGVKFSFAIFSVETKIPTILSQNLPCFLHLRFKQQAPSEWASDKKKGSMTVSFPKTWKFNHFLCLILSSLRKMSETASATPSLWKKVSWWQFNKTTEFATWEFFFEKRSSWP